MMIGTRQWIGWASVVVCFAGCGTSAPNAVPPATTAVDAIEKHVTFHVPKMCEQLRLL